MLKHSKTITLAAATGLVFGGASAYAEGKGHEPVTFCHNGHTITTDNQGLVNGHMRHVESGKDYLGECVTAPEPSVTPTPKVTPTVEIGTPVSEEATPASPVTQEPGYTG